MKPETREKVARCKALQGIAVGEFIRGEKFLANLAVYWADQKDQRTKARASYDAMHKLGTSRGYKLPAHSVDHFLGWTVGEIAAEYGRILDKRSDLSSRERQYLLQLGDQAFNLTIAEIACEEFPELRDELLPETKDDKNC